MLQLTSAVARLLEEAGERAAVLHTLADALGEREERVLVAAEVVADAACTCAA